MNTESITPNPQVATSDTSPSAFSQVAVVGAVTMTLAGVSFLATLVLVLSLWMPAWVATFATTLLLTATSLAVFASGKPGSRLRGAPINSGYVAFSAASLGAQPAPVLESVFHESGVYPSHESGVHPSPVHSVEAAQEIEAAEFEDALPENDDQETTVVRNADRLLYPGEHTGLGQHVGLGQRTTRPMFQKTTQQSLAR